MHSPAPPKSFVRTTARRVFSLAALALALWAPRLAAETSAVPLGPAPAPELPLAERFVSPVGDPTDYSLPAPGESKGYALTRGVQRKRDRHMGLDLSNRQRGGEVRAPADGVVIESRRYGGWGQLVVIAHRLASGETVMSLLAHLQPGSVRVKTGDRVTAGQPLAAVGQSGHASGPHLHFEMRKLGHADPWRTLWERAPVLDPLRVLGRRLEEAMLAGTSKKSAAPAVGAEFLTQLAETKKGGKARVGDPAAPLTRLEFYAWLDQASRAGARPAKPTWKRLRQNLAKSGVVLPRTTRAYAAPVSIEEAQDALARLLAAQRLTRLDETTRVSASDLERRSLPLPSPSLANASRWTMGPSPVLSRGDGALLVLAARSWPFTGTGKP